MNIQLKLCPFCKAQIPADGVYCDLCGKKLLVCPSCGSFAKSKRCTNCGHATEEINADKIFNTEQKTTVLIPGHLVCLSSNLRLGLSDGAIIGRRGSYGTAFQQFPSISGLHAKLIYTCNSWKIEDIGSSYGTFINGKELEKNSPKDIGVGDILKFANIEFKVTE